MTSHPTASRRPPSYPAPSRAAIEELAEARARLESDQGEVKARSVEAVPILHGWCDASTRDIAAILGLSHQRVSQLLQET